MYKLIISVAFLLSSIHANAQLDTAALKLKYEKEVIYFSGVHYIKGDIKYRYKQLKNEFNFSPEGMQAFKMHESDARKSRRYARVGLAVFTSALVVGFNTDQDQLALGLLIGAYVPMVVSIHFSTRAHKKMQKAVWLRNRDVLLN